MASTNAKAVNLLDYEAMALDAGMDTRILDFVNGGACDEITIADNQSAFKRLRLIPRVLASTDDTDMTTTVLGKRVELPFFIAPSGQQQLMHAEGSMPLAHAAAKTGILMVLSFRSGTDLGEVATAGGVRWLQIRPLRDRAIVEDLIRRAEAAGYDALVLTVDAPVSGYRERDLRSGFTGEARASRTSTEWKEVGPQPGSWQDLEWLVSNSRIPIVVKGILSPLDASRAVSCGAAGIYVSNHGGRQLDTSIATIDALPAVADAVGSSAELYLDGGVRRGTDVVKALSLGARAVGLGRPPLWGMIVNGEDGVTNVVRLLAEETRRAQILTGQSHASSVDRDLIAH